MFMYLENVQVYGIHVIRTSIRDIKGIGIFADCLS